MIRLTKNLATVIPLASTPAAAADNLTLQSPATLFFTLAAAIILTLLFRKSAGVAADRVARMIWRRTIRKRLDGLEYLEDALLPGAYGGLVRIDFAVRLPGGIACLRLVRADGALSGGADDAQWSVVCGARQRRMLNPMIQNEGRARAIRKIVGAVPVHPLTIVNGGLKSFPDCVVPAEKLRNALNSIDSAESPDLEEAWMELKDAVLRDPDTQKDFAAQVGFC